MKHPLKKLFPMTSLASCLLFASACGGDDCNNIAGGCTITPGSDGGTTAPEKPLPEPEKPPITQKAWSEFGLDPILDSVVLHYLGQAWDQSSDVGEVLETVSRIDPSIPGDWMHEWEITARRLLKSAETSLAAGHRLSAGAAYLRAATYFRAALHHQDDPFAPEVKKFAEEEVAAFEKYLEYSNSPCSSVQIPYEHTTLPGYFCRSALAGSDPAPVIIFQEGRDAWAEDGKFVADEAMRRGYHALLFDGPGMAKVLRIQGLVFRHDWEAVITPVIDFTETISGVDPNRLALLSVSMGGFMGPRAAAFEHRLKLLIANPGVLRWADIYEDYLKAIDPSLIDLLESDPDTFNATIETYMGYNETLNWGMIDSQWHHGVKTAAELMKELQNFEIGEAVKDITTKTLVADAEAEEWGQSKRLYDALICPKDTIMFKAEETAQFHVQPGARGIFTQKIFDWIDDNI